MMEEWYAAGEDIFVGAVNTRYYLNDSLLLNGGYIGDGAGPSERRKGVATKMIGLALEECKELGIHRVLMVCDKKILALKSILKNGSINSIGGMKCLPYLIGESSPLLMT